MGVAALTAALHRLRGGPYPLLPAGERPAVTFPASPLVTRVHIALGADLTASHLTWNWLDITEWVRHDLGITIVAGRQDERNRVNPSRCQLKLENTDGRFSRRNPMSPYYGLLTKNTPIWIELNPGSGFVDRYFGFVNEWPTRWTDPSGTDCTVTIQCAGVLRRLAQRAKPITSTLRRTVLSNSPTAYWPMDDAEGASSFASAVGGPAWPTVDVIGNDDTLAGAGAALPIIDIQVGAIYASVPNYTDTGRWSVFGCIKPIHEGTLEEALLQSRASDGYIYQIVIGGTGGTVFGFFVFDPDFNLLASPTTTVPRVTGQWWTVSITSSSADTITATLYDISGNLIATVSQANPGTHQQLTQVRAVGFSPEAAAFGHVFVITDPSVDLTELARVYSWAAGGFAGEMAHERMRRLCREYGVPFYCQAATSARVGPQPVGSVLNLLRECETADQGVLYEREFGLAFQSVSERYNQPVALALDFNAGHIAGTPEPADDDQLLVNLFTATRSSGLAANAATAEQATGTLGTGPGGSGVYEDSATVNVEADAQLADYAGWKVHLGTVDEDRWPQIGFHLHGNPSLIPQWPAVPYGARVNIANPPSQMSQDTIDGIIEGYAERWDTVSWSAGLNISPASPYTVGVVDDTDQRIDSGSSTLAASVTAGASSLSVTTADIGDLWSTDAADCPQDVTIAGIHVTVSSITSVVEDTFTRTEANGWGPADTGQAWSVLAGSASNFATSGGRGIITLPTGDTDPRMIVLPTTFVDLDLYVPMAVSAVATGQAIVAEAVFRAQDADNFYRATFGFTTSSTIDVSLVRVSGGAGTSLASSTGVLTYVNNVDAYLYVQAQGSQLRVKASSTALTAPPTSWTLTATDTAYASGLAGFRARLVSGNTNVNPQVSTDNLEVFNPQTFAVTGATVTKNLAAGEQFHVRYPIVLGL